MSPDVSRKRDMPDRDEPDEWLIDAARRMGHPIPARARTRGTTAWRVLLNAGVPDAEVLRIACTVSGADPADFAHLSPAFGSLLSQGVALKHRVVPLGVRDGALAVATTNPIDAVLERELAFAAKQRVRLHPGSPSEIIRAQAIVYGAAYGTRADSGIVYPTRPAPPSATSPQAKPVTRLSLSVPAVAHSTPTSAAPVPAEPPPVPPNLIDRLLLSASTERASEAILEPERDGGFLVRLRVDGVVHDRFRIAEAHVAAMVLTLKERAGLDIDGSRRAQEGRTAFDAPTGRISVRVSIEIVREVGREARERVVLRLYTAGGLLRVADLGCSPAEQHRLAQLLGAGSGLVVIAGPARAGKTATLYAAARDLRLQGRQVATIEDEIEQPLDNVRQMQLRGAPHTTVGSALAVIAASGARPAVVVTDAPLDASTLEQCAMSSDRPRLLVAALDTADLPATLAHLRALHPDGAPLAASLQGVVVQRLVRRLCSCALPQLANELPAQQQRLLYGLPAAHLRRPVGCPACRTTGYLGRMAILEIAPVTDALRSAITRRAAAAELVHMARESGISSLWDSGMHHVLAGATSLAELLDHVSPPETGDAAPQEDIDALLSQLLDSMAKDKKKNAPSPAPAAKLEFDV